ncbi:hypothetical protein AB0B68_05865 [Micromonospora sp. NPDC049049]|uniref:hypothetical protein n=1 Tax=Micromonospora sp. NPDC049049 TaxID=3155495 RepID=UPI0033ECC44F
MKPAEVVGIFGWIGWVIGLGAGILQILAFNRDRRLGPAKEQLFEEALRDRKGKYSEEQILELTELVRMLERSARSEIPRQAKRVFLESQLEAIRDTVFTGVKQHQLIVEELNRLDGQSKEIPAQIAAVVETSIVPPAIERHRQQRRLYLVVVVLVVVALFPNAWDYLQEAAVDVLGDQPWPFGPQNTLDFFAGCAISVCIAFALPDAWLRRFVRTRRRVVLAVAILGWSLATAGILYIGLSLGLGNISSYEVQVGILAVVLIGAAAKATSVQRHRHG